MDRGTANGDFRRAGCVVYEPGRHTGWGPRIWAEMAQELWSSRELAWRLFIRDFTGRYKQTLTGVAGAVIAPVASVGTFLLLSTGGVLDVGEMDVPYPVFAFLSLTIWGLFSAGVAASANAIASNAAFITKVNFPKEALIFATLGQTLVDVLIRALLMAAVFAAYRTAPAWTIVLMPLAMVPLLLLTLGVGFVTALGNALVRDVGKGVTMALTFLMLVTPVLYVAPKNDLFALITRWNILAGLVSAPRELALTGKIENPIHFFWSSFAAFLIFCIGWRLFHLSEARLAERLGGR